MNDLRLLFRLSLIEDECEEREEAEIENYESGSDNESSYTLVSKTVLVKPFKKKFK